MNRLVRTMSSSIGAKWVMALTGLGLLGFVIAHMLGNLQLFLGQDAYNGYAHKLQSMGGLLWVARLGLLALLLAHVAAAVKVTRSNRAARPAPYATPQRSAVTSYAARTMFLTGLAVLAFVIFHLAHYTFGIVQPDSFSRDNLDLLGRPDAYGMMIAGFSNPLVAALYVVAHVPLCLHIGHGASSLFHTLGCTHPRFACLRDGCFGRAVGWGIFVLNSSMPLAVLLGYGR